MFPDLFLSRSSLGRLLSNVLNISEFADDFLLFIVWVEKTKISCESDDRRYDGDRYRENLEQEHRSSSLSFTHWVYPEVETERVN